MSGEYLDKVNDKKHIQCFYYFILKVFVHLHPTN